jgi:hypothetical protein
MSEDTVERIRETAPWTGDASQLTDDDIRQLIIHHATIIRRPPGQAGECSARARAVINTWESWPKDLRDRFYSMVLESRDRFWARPADINNGIGRVI